MNDVDPQPAAIQRPRPALPCCPAHTAPKQLSSLASLQPHLRNTAAAALLLLLSQRTLPYQAGQQHSGCNQCRLPALSCGAFVCLGLRCTRRDRVGVGG